MNAQAAVLTLSTMLGAAACASSRPNPFEDNPGAQSTITVEVDNNNFNDATVYAITRQGEQRLGIVAGKARKTFRARLSGPDQVRLKVRLLAGGSFTTHPMPAGPGEVLVLIIPAALEP